ncbi:MAG: KTSC domain-containing protein [Candidatus Brocadiales bacterium]|nr:KTSC domain-containing protein [Candidatus Bathyanammoxibius sp.]
MPKPEMKSVESSNIWQIGYDAKNTTLYIQFNEGGLYSYADFPTDMWEEFQASDSKGRFFYKAIKGRFDFTKIE